MNPVTYVWAGWLLDPLARQHSSRLDLPTAWRPMDEQFDRQDVTYEEPSSTRNVTTTNLG